MPIARDFAHRLMPAPQAAHYLGVSTRPERLNEITAEDVEREGFPEFTPADFVRFLSQKTGCTADVIINRIEFRYIEEGRADHGQAM